jgi:hypothetical protein
MSDDDAPPRVLRLVPKATTDVTASSRHCRHVGTLLCESSRRVSCKECGALLDAFDVLMQYARRERTWRHWDAETRQARLDLQALKSEERAVKSRTANALRKDADHAVAEERRKSEKNRRAIASAAKEMIALGWKIMRLTRSDGAESDNVSTG